MKNKHRSLTKNEIVEFDLIKTENGYKTKKLIINSRLEYI